MESLSEWEDVEPREKEKKKKRGKEGGHESIIERTSHQFVEQVVKKQQTEGENERINKNSNSLTIGELAAAERQFCEQSRGKWN